MILPFRLLHFFGLPANSICPSVEWAKRRAKVHLRHCASNSFFPVGNKGMLMPSTTLYFANKCKKTWLASARRWGISDMTLLVLFPTSHNSFFFRPQVKASKVYLAIPFQVLSPHSYIHSKGQVRDPYLRHVFFLKTRFHACESVCDLWSMPS